MKNKKEELSSKQKSYAILLDFEMKAKIFIIR